jgi:hypothetical protein
VLIISLQNIRHLQYFTIWPLKLMAVGGTIKELVNAKDRSKFVAVGGTIKELM